MANISTEAPAQIPESPASDVPEENGDGWSVSRIATIAVAGFVGVMVLIFIVALVMAINDVERAARIIQILRDIIIIAMAMEGILIITSIAVLVVQIARLTNLVRSEVKPIVDGTRETVDGAKVTAEFVSKSLAEPLIQLKSFWAGLSTFVRETLAIRRAIRPDEETTDDSAEG